MSFTLFLVATMLASAAALVCLLALPQEPGARVANRFQPLHGLRFAFSADDLLD